jgi:hypothetical protein
MMRPAATGDVVAVLCDAELESLVERDAIRSREEWQFKLGQCISHKDQPMPSLVVGRERTSKGREVYVVKSYSLADPLRDRMMLAEVLVDVEPGGEPCRGCTLYRTALCPGLR